MSKEEKKILRICLIGAAGVGKKSLILRYLGEDFYFNPRRIFTCSRLFLLGIDIQSKTVLDENSGRKVEIYIYIATVDIYIACFSLDSSHSLTHLVETWLPEIKSVEKDITLFLVGTKNDLVQLYGNEIEKKDIQTVQEMLNSKAFIKTSAKTPQNVNELFEKAVSVCLGSDAERGKLVCCLIL